MAYTTVANVQSLLLGVATVDIKILYLTMADNIINAKIGSRYTIPFTTTPPIIETIATDLSAYYTMRALFTNDSQNKSEWVASYKEAMKMLDDIADGKIPVVDISGNELAYKVQSLQSSNEDYHPIFDIDNIDNSVIDDNLITEIQDAK